MPDESTTGDEANQQSRGAIQDRHFELLTLEARFRRFRLAVTAGTVIVTIGAAALPLTLARSVVQEFAGQEVRVRAELSFYAVSLAALSLTVVLVLLQKTRLLRAQLKRSRTHLRALEDEVFAAVDDGGSPSSSQTAASDGQKEPVENEGQVPAVAPSGEGVGQPPVTVNIQTADGDGDKGRWSPGTVALLLVALISGGFGVAQALVSRDEAPIDCIEYNRRLQELDETYSPEQLARALDGFSFGRYDQGCGDARSYLRRLHTTTSVAGAK